MRRPSREILTTILMGAAVLPMVGCTRVESAFIHMEGQFDPTAVRVCQKIIDAAVDPEDLVGAVDTTLRDVAAFYDSIGWDRSRDLNLSANPEETNAAFCLIGGELPETGYDKRIVVLYALADGARGGALWAY